MAAPGSPSRLAGTAAAARPRPRPLPLPLLLLLLLAPAASSSPSYAPVTNPCLLPNGTACPFDSVANSSSLICQPCPDGKVSLGCSCAECRDGEFCSGGLAEACPVPERCLAKNTCALGFSGDYCLTCAAGRFVNTAGECVACNGSRSSFLALLVVGVGGAVAAFYLALRYRAKHVILAVNSRTRVLVTAFEYASDIPSTLSWFLAIPSFIFLRFQDTDVRCVVPTMTPGLTDFSGLLVAFGLWALSACSFWYLGRCSVTCCFQLLCCCCRSKEDLRDTDDDDEDDDDESDDEDDDSEPGFTATNPAFGFGNKAMQQARRDRSDRSCFRSACIFLAQLTTVSVPGIISNIVGRSLSAENSPVLIVNQTGQAFFEADSSYLAYSFPPGMAYIEDGKVRAPAILNATYVREPSAAFNEINTYGYLMVFFACLVTVVYCVAELRVCACAWFCGRDDAPRYSDYSDGSKRKWARWVRFVDTGFGAFYASMMQVNVLATKGGFANLALFLMFLFKMPAFCSCCRCCRRRCGHPKGLTDTDPVDCGTSCCGSTRSPAPRIYRSAENEYYGMVVDLIFSIGYFVLVLFQTSDKPLSDAKLNAVGIFFLAIILPPWIAAAATLCCGIKRAPRIAISSTLALSVVVAVCAAIAAGAM